MFSILVSVSEKQSAFPGDSWASCFLTLVVAPLH